ncbi:hypothetical protein LU293_04895 [Moraxella nasovis]|uniref:hypothetical protein n=1 Tax=Moraxella nasovis TaxID=2904121 RepID=UPI001F617B0A|nr:hypothetical protein [Moraxella nasovis]UNU74234.1 hypothetical protein LU293_04895 [Moraxella nasovis]
MFDLPISYQHIISKKAALYGMSEIELITKAIESYEPALFDSDELKQSIDSGFVEVPDWALTDLDSMDKWLKNP